MDADGHKYTVEMVVDDNSPIHGKSIETAGLRHLLALYLLGMAAGP